MSGGVASGPRARELVATSGGRAGARGGDGERHRAGVLGAPAPLHLPAGAFYVKDDVFGICDALARAEAALTRLGARDEAARVAQVFELVEAGLAG